MMGCRTIAARLAAFLTAFAVAVGASSSSFAETESSPGASVAQRCQSLTGLEIPKDVIGLASTGGKISSASPIEKITENNAKTGAGAFCKVLGEIRSVDPAAQPVKFQLNLPQNWNHKIVHIGGGGFVGLVVSAVGAELDKGYATFGTDTGHKGDPAKGIMLDAGFALNDEQLTNYAGDSLKKTYDAALWVVERHYAEKPRRRYFVGGSNGGRQALLSAQRWPHDYDGIVAEFPAVDKMGMFLHANRIAKAIYTPGGWLNEAKTRLLYTASITACDTLDGAQDGIIANIAACHFDPVSLRCPSGSDDGDRCLSDQQIKTLHVIHSPARFPFAIPYGGHARAGYNVFEGADFGPMMPGLPSNFGANAMAENPPNFRTASGLHFFASEAIKYLIVRNPDFDALTFDERTYEKRIAQLAEMMDPSPDLAAFSAAGGKMIVSHGSGDAVDATQPTIDYYKQVVGILGQKKTDDFARLYIVPGQGHGVGTFNARTDYLGALEAWVEQGVAPETLTATDANPATKGRTRPVCRYPAWPKYNGSGDVNAAESFHCTGE